MILFLDFDGVLHPQPSLTEPTFCRLGVLEHWLRQRPAISVVISSSWREAHSVDELVGLFAEDLQRRVLGVTPVLTLSGDDEPRHARQLEIEAWLERSGAPAQAWLAIDDQARLFSPGCRQLVVCDASVGLTARELGELDRLIGGPSSAARDFNE